MNANSGPVRAYVSIGMEPWPLCFVGAATTSVVPPWHAGGRRVWEVGIIRREPDGTERTSHMFIRRADVNMGRVPREQLEQALKAGRYHQRYPEAANLPMGTVYSAGKVAQIVAAVTQDAYLIGVDVDFYATSFAHLLHAYGLWNRADPPWRRYLVDARNEGGGALGLPIRQRGVDDLAAGLDVDLTRYTRHQAADEAAIARDLFDAAFARHGLNPVGGLPPGSEAPLHAAEHGLDEDTDLSDQT